MSVLTSVNYLSFGGFLDVRQIYKYFNIISH